MSKWVIHGKSTELADLVTNDFPFGISDSERSIREFVQEWFSENGNFEIYTSGSTGKPKKILVQKDAMEQSARMTGVALGLKSGMMALLAMDPQYIAGKMMIARALTLGLDLIIVPPSRNPFETIDENIDIDFTALVPYQLGQVLEKGLEGQLNNLKILLVGGGSISEEFLQKIKALEVSTYHSYGMTETVSHVALKRINGPGKSDLFKTLDGISIEADERGCLIISGAFLTEPVITNDVVELVDKEHFRWLGRYDNVVNSGGIKIHPEIEEPKIGEVLDSLGLKNFRFFLGGIPDKILGERLTLFIEGSPSLNNEYLIARLKPTFDKYHAPKEVIWIDTFKETKTGKFKRREMIEENRIG